MKPILVLKVGTKAVTTETGELNVAVMKNMATELAKLSQNYNCILVSSGAAGAGQGKLKNFNWSLEERKAAAAIGNPILIGKYQELFSEYNICTAQALCERHHFASRSQFLQLKSTFKTLWRNNVIPICNENDVTSDLELRFSDNDELATLLAVGFSAEKLLLGTSVEGVLDCSGKLITEISDFSEPIFRCVNDDDVSVGLGGMLSKLNCANMATSLGVETIIFEVRERGNIVKAVEGKTGTRCIAQPSTHSAQQKWIASSSITAGKIMLDAGAVSALKNRKSLLAVGIEKIHGNFPASAIVEICDTSENKIAVGQTRFGSENFPDKTQKSQIVVHADKIVLL